MSNLEASINGSNQATTSYDPLKDYITHRDSFRCPSFDDMWTSKGSSDEMKFNFGHTNSLQKMFVGDNDDYNEDKVEFGLNMNPFYFTFDEILTPLSHNNSRLNLGDASSQTEEKTDARFSFSYISSNNQTNEKAKSANNLWKQKSTSKRLSLNSLWKLEPTKETNSNDSPCSKYSRTSNTKDADFEMESITSTIASPLTDMNKYVSEMLESAPLDCESTQIEPIVVSDWSTIKKRMRKSVFQTKTLVKQYNLNSNWDKAHMKLISKLTGLSHYQVYKWYWEQEKDKTSTLLTTNPHF